MLKKFIYILIIISFCYCQKIKAIEPVNYDGYIYPDEYINGTYIKMVKPSGWSKYFTAQTIKRSSDNSLVYCLEPYITVDSTSRYQIYSNNYAEILNISPSTWERVTQLAYYGYGYVNGNINHQSSKWWIITQMLIWQTLNPESDIYYTKTLNGAKDSSKYQAEIQELEKLVSGHNSKPEFNDIPKIIANTSTTLYDVKNVLEDYTIEFTPNINIITNNNRLVIETEHPGQYDIKFTKKKYYQDNIILYFSSSSQKVMSVGNTSPVTSNLKIEVIQPQLIIQKYDQETTNSQGEATLQGAVYGLYNSNDELIDTLTISKNNSATFTNFTEYGEYYLQEITPSIGYTLNKNKYHFKLTEENYQINLKLPEKVIKGQIKIIKKDYDTKQKDPCFKDTIFQVFDSNNNLVETLIVDETSTTPRITLPYGKYYIKETKAVKGYKLDPKIYEVSITKDQSVYEIFSYNEKIKSQIKIIKKDYDTKQSSSIFHGTTYEIYNIKNELVDTLTIDETSTAISKLLPYGTYYVKEIKTIQGYKLDEKLYEIFITEDKKIYEIESYNEKIKGQIKIIKKDYDTKQLSSIFQGTTYEIYNIKNELVETLIIDEKSTATSKELPYGQYYIKEKTTIIGYKINEKTYPIFISENQKIYEIVTYNKKIKGQIKIIKKDQQTFNPIANTYFSLFNSENTFIGEYITDFKGEVTIKNLEYGQYILQETKSNKKYYLESNPLLITITDETPIIKTIFNSPKPIEIPFTSKNSFNCSLLLLLIGMIVCGKNFK